MYIYNVHLHTINFLNLNYGNSLYILQNIISTPVSKALKLHFEQAVIPGDTDIPIAIGALIYDCM